MGETWTIDGFRQKLDELGESEVRRRLAGSVYGPPRSEKYLLVEQWLSDKASERENERDAAASALARESNAIAREANALASAANTISARAEKRATTANKIAIAAALITLASIFGPPLVDWIKSASAPAVPVASVSPP